MKNFFVGGGMGEWGGEKESHGAGGAVAGGRGNNQG